MANFTIRFQSKPLPNGKERPIRKMGVPQYIRDPEGETPEGVSPSHAPGRARGGESVRPENYGAG